MEKRAGQVITDGQKIVPVLDDRTLTILEQSFLISSPVGRSVKYSAKITEHKHWDFARIMFNWTF